MNCRPKATNSRSTLRRRKRCGTPMAAYDQLPSELQQWLAQAGLPWSPQSALRLWQKTLRACDGDRSRAWNRLSEIETHRLSQECQRIWGREHPAMAGVAPEPAALP
ncbi:MAG: DUF6525 family protein [Rhodobacterales bacterium]